MIPEQVWDMVLIFSEHDGSSIVRAGMERRRGEDHCSRPPGWVQAMWDGMLTDTDARGALWPPSGGVRHFYHHCKSVRGFPVHAEELPIFLSYNEGL